MRHMKIAVFGTGIVGRTLASPRELGHDVAIGTRDPRPPWPGLSRTPWATRPSLSGSRTKQPLAMDQFTRNGL